MLRLLSVLPAPIASRFVRVVRIVPRAFSGAFDSRLWPRCLNRQFLYGSHPFDCLRIRSRAHADTMRSPGPAEILPQLTASVVP